jgi:hypothetical protein
MQKSTKLKNVEKGNKGKLFSWHSFLRISSTYELAIRYRAGKLTPKEQNTLPPNFHQVLLTYDRFGDVWAETADSWYEENALTALQVIKGANQPKIVSSLFAGNEENAAISLAKHVVGAWEQQGKQPELLISVPINAKKSDIYKLLEDALEDLRLDVKNGDVPKGQDVEKMLNFNLMDTKVRLELLQKMNELVILRAIQPQLLNWELAQQIGLSPALVANVAKAHELEKSNGKRLQMADRATGDKLVINSLVGRYLRKAFLLAENAAYGKFPCFDELPKVDGKIVRTYFDDKAIANGTTREYYRLHGKRPDKNENNNHFNLYKDDEWWEDSIWSASTPSKRQAEIDLGDANEHTDDTWWTGTEDDDGAPKAS